MKKSKIIKLLFFLALFVFFLLPATDPDLGWHLRCGEEIWTKHTLCNINTFSVLLPGYRWTNHFWFYQLTIYPIQSAFGRWGLTVFNAIAVTLAFLFFYQAIKNFTFEKMLAIFAIIFFGWGVFSFGIRAQLFGFLFFDLLLFLLSKIKEKPKLAFFIPLTMLFWANTHGSAIIGLVLLFFFCARQVYEKLQKTHSVIILLPSVIILLFSALITLLNPFGIGIYQESWQHVFGTIDLSKLIAEWVPPNPNIYWTIIVSCLCLLLYYLITATPKEIILAFLILPFAFLAVQARRHVHFYFTSFFYLLFTLPTSKKLFDSWRKQRVLRRYLVLIITLVFLLGALFFRLPRTYRTNGSWGSYCQASPVTVPCDAVEFLKEQNVSGNIFNRYEWGGFLIWQLPEYKVFVDGRMPAWNNETGKSPYTIYLETLQTRPDGGQAQPGWQEILDEYNIDWILISPGTFMDLLLQPNPEEFGWQEVYRDKISVVYKRKS